MAQRIAPPEPGEYNPYYQKYIDRVTGKDVLGTLVRQPAWLRALLAPLSDDEARSRYAEGKWSVKEVVGHLADTERVFAYRALRFGRGDATALPGFDENDFVAGAHFHDSPLEERLADFDAVRAATLTLLRSLAPADLERRGTANGAEISVRALACIMAGHVEHHLAILRDRYALGGPLPDAPAD